MKEIVASEYEKEVLTGGNVLVDFYSTECPPCEAIAPKLEGLEILFRKEIKFLKIFRQGNRDRVLDLNPFHPDLSFNLTLIFRQRLLRI